MARIDRLPPTALRAQVQDVTRIAPVQMFRVLRSQIEGYGRPADVTLPSLAELPDALR